MWSPIGAVVDGPVMLAVGASSGGQGTGSYGTYAPSSGVHPYAHYAVIAWFVFAAVGLILLDRGGFRFMMQAGKR